MGVLNFGAFLQKKIFNTYMASYALLGVNFGIHYLLVAKFSRDLLVGQRFCTCLKLYCLRRKKYYN